MKYQVIVKEIPEMIVYSSETILAKYADVMQGKKFVTEAIEHSIVYPNGRRTVNPLWRESKE